MAEAITDAIDDLRRAVLRARDGAPTASTAEDLAASIEAVADALRETAWRARPLETRIAGVYYAVGDPPCVRLLPGDSITLRRDPDNRYDGNAVAVLAPCGTRVGYLPRGDAADLAPLLDRGLAASAVVSEAKRTDIIIDIHGPAVDAFRSTAARGRALVV